MQVLFSEFTCDTTALWTRPKIIDIEKIKERNRRKIIKIAYILNLNHVTGSLK